MVIRKDYTRIFENIFANDEMYFGTVLVMEGYPVDDIVNNKDITWTYWEKRKSSPKDHLGFEAHHAMEALNSDAFFARKFAKTSDIESFGFHL